MLDGKPVTITCVECGIRFIRVHPSQKYCPDCAMAKKNRHYVVGSRKLSKAEREAMKPAHVPSRVPPELESWSTRGKSLALVDAEARELGLSYGKYMAAIQGGSIERLLTARGMTPSDWKAALAAAKRKVGRR